jgi:hypothetical protein
MGSGIAAQRSMRVCSLAKNGLNLATFLNPLSYVLRDNFTLSGIGMVGNFWVLSLFERSAALQGGRCRAEESV